MFGLRRPVVWAAVAAVGVVIVGQAAFANANTVPITSAGQGSAVTSGFTITGITYTLNGANPLNIDSVAYTATAINGQDDLNLLAKTKFDASAGWYACTDAPDAVNAAEYDIVCDTTVGTQLLVADADVVNAVIVQTP
jgi:hypothetical protein